MYTEKCGGGEIEKKRRVLLDHLPVSRGCPYVGITICNRYRKYKTVKFHLKLASTRKLLYVGKD